MVDLDRALYSVSDADFARLIDRLQQDPFVGDAVSEGRYEYQMNGLSVSYSAVVGAHGAYVLIAGIRPPEAVSETQKVLDLADRTLRGLKKIREVAGLF